MNPTLPEKGTEPDFHDPEVAASLSRYWKSNVKIMSILLVIWAVAGLGCGVLFADMLNQFNLPGTGYPLGFWFAQQGSIIVFVLCILIYSILLNKLDTRHHEELQALKAKGEG